MLSGLRRIFSVERATGRVPNGPVGTEADSLPQIGADGRLRRKLLAPHYRRPVGEPLGRELGAERLRSSRSPMTIWRRSTELGGNGCRS
jgi:hypothetical protein